MVDLFFYLFSSILIGSAIGVVLAKNSVHSVLLLMASFLNAAALFIMLGAEFLAFILIIVYVGAVAVLFLFVVMMLPSSAHFLQQQLKQQTIFVVSIMGVMGGELFLLLKQWPIVQKNFSMDVPLLTTKSLGDVLYTDYFIDFQLGGIVLFIAILGAIVLTLLPRPFSKKQQISAQISRTREETLEIHSMPSQSGKN